MKKILVAALVLLGVTGMMAQDCSDLFFSEYIEGSGNNKGVEVYNPTSDIVDLSAYYVARYSNGSFSYDAGGITQLQGFLQPFETHFLVNGQTVSTETSPACDPALQALAQQLDHEYPAPTYMNGNDAIALFKDLGGSGDPAEFAVMDLFGIIGGGMTSSDEGWTDFTEAWAYKNIYENDEIVDRDSIWISNYIVPEGYYWLPWSMNHSLIRKSSVKQGVKENPSTEFIVAAQWDTATGGNNVWDSLGFHVCDCQFVGIEGREESWFRTYPNPASDYLQIESDLPLRELLLVDALGREVIRLELHKVLYHRLDLNGIITGVYTLQLLSGQSVQNKRIIIAH